MKTQEGVHKEYNAQIMPKIMKERQLERNKSETENVDQKVR